MKLWGGRFSKPTDTDVEAFTASIEFDHVLAEFDIQGSLAHVSVLQKAGLIDTAEAAQLSAGLEHVRQKLLSGDVDFSIADEDIHMNIERALHAHMGELAGKLHTGRSRNDQVATDLHLYSKHHVLLLIEKLHQVQKVLLDLAKAHKCTVMPGYTHLQRAQPVTFAQHMLAYFWMFDRDRQRFSELLSRVDISPLGAGALAGAGFGLDREHAALQLGFSHVYENSMDAVSDRDFIIELLSAASIFMMHMSRLSEELIQWSSVEFGFVSLDDAFCTGSSMMPQKKNPDVPELVRGKTGRVYGALFAMLTVLKALPMTYNKDMQEDKSGLFDTVETLHQVLDIMPKLLATMSVHREVMLAAASDPASLATELADYLVKKGLPFRAAHGVVGTLVALSESSQRALNELSLDDLQDISPLFESDVMECLQLSQALNARYVRGGVAPAALDAQLMKAEQVLSSQPAKASAALA